MSNTRKAIPTDNAPLSQERYMSSPEFAELRGISGTAVAARAAVVEDPAIRSLLWFLQAKSLEPGGLKRVAAELLERFADRIGTPSMHKFGMKPGQIYNASQVRAVRAEVEGGNFILRGEARSHFPYDDSGYCDAAQQLADAETEFDRSNAEQDLAASKRHPVSYPASEFMEICQYCTEDLPAFLTDLCINPRLAFVKPGAGAADRSYKQRLENEFPQQKLTVRAAQLWWFPDVVGALLDYQRQQEQAAREDFALTAIAQKVWDTLDFALKSGRMVVVEGWEGRGKSEAAKAWVRMHTGTARFVSLKGVANKTTVFREISRALGIACSYKRKSTEMQARIEDVLLRSRLMLVFDEAHFFFSQSARVYTRPELIDWVDTALANHDVPCAFITTPQFINCVKRAEEQAGWNYRQFRRRVRRWVQLPEWNTDEDLKTVARRIMPGITAHGSKLALGYAKMSLQGSPSRDISGLGDVAMEARLNAERAGREAVTFEDIEAAVNELIQSDTAFASRMAVPAKRSRKGHASPLKAPLTPLSEPDQTGESDEAAGDNFIARRLPVRPALADVLPPRAERELVPA